MSRKSNRNLYCWTKIFISVLFPNFYNIFSLTITFRFGLPDEWEWEAAPSTITDIRSKIRLFECDGFLCIECRRNFFSHEGINRYSHVKYFEMFYSVNVRFNRIGNKAEIVFFVSHSKAIRLHTRGTLPPNWTILNDIRHLCGQLHIRCMCLTDWLTFLLTGKTQVITICIGSKPEQVIIKFVKLMSETGSRTDAS